MTNRAAVGFYWRNDAVVIYSTPSGCKYTGQAVPMGNAARDGISVCSGAKLGASGGAFIGDAGAYYCELWLLKSGSWVATLATGGILSGQFAFSAPDYGNTAYIISDSGTYSLAVVYKVQNDNNLYGSVLETDIKVSVYSMDVDPAITIHTNSYMRGIDANKSSATCAMGSTCSFMENSTVAATLEFVIQGGAPNGIEYNFAVQKINYTSWVEVTSQSLGVISPGTWIKSVNFALAGTDRILGSEYRMALSHRTVNGATQIYYTMPDFRLKEVSASITQCNQLTVEITRIDPMSVTTGSTAGVYVKVHNPTSSPSNPCKVNLTCTAGDTSWIGATVDIPSINPQAYSPEIRGAYTATQNAKGTVNICATIV